jgi:Co/Zn/Cd efflux system component
MDPAMGIVGAIVIAHWAVTLVRSSGAVLLDTVPDTDFATELRKRLEVGTDRVSDLHVWRVGPGHAAVVASVVADEPMMPDRYKDRLKGIDGLSHVTVEVYPCTLQ